MKQLNELTKCPLCGHEKFVIGLSTRDYMITQEVFHISECDGCGFWFTNPIPKEEEIGEYYKHETYVSHSSSRKGVINRVYNLVRKLTLKNKRKLIQTLTPKGKIVDYGCGTGHFLNELHLAGYDVMGFEPDGDARNFTKENFNINTKPLGEFRLLENNSVDAISMWHVLEHVYNLKQDFAEIVKKLKSGGHLIVAVPNRNSADAKKYREYWAAYDVPRHLYHFVPKDIELLANEFDLTLDKMLPMKYDSFYVSMLSEKYKKGNVFRALWSGLISNGKAKEGEYSSQIYILRKTHKRL